MSSTNGGHYDLNLLAQAPEATRAQKQEGYDAVLLAPNRMKRSQSDVVLNAISEEKVPLDKRPTALAAFWKRRGGAVGSTVQKNKNKTKDDTADEGVGAVGQSGIFGSPVATSSQAPSETSQVQGFSQGSVATEVVASDITAQVTARHFFTTRRR
ncbi:hypothetical protein B0H10DRAFT_1078352 [Mycena sp. CBHHK59/15]|nr:hypothetical protein B0H10DRAFT_1078352 [Mycena sp. CBHHK59/15]